MGGSCFQPLSLHAGQSCKLNLVFTIFIILLVYYSGFFIKKHVTCQVIGAFWYLFSIERQDTCWHEVCKDQARCDTMYRYCGDHRKKDYTFPTESCPFIQPDQVHNSTVFNFGIFIDALDSGVVESTYFPRKFFYCFWWGLRNLRFVNILFSISVPNQSPCSHLYYLKLHPALIHF